jgi:site-specific DNA recombinase
VAVPQLAGAAATFVRVCEGRLTRTGLAVRLVQNDGALRSGLASNSNLLRLIIKARNWWAILAEGELTATELAAREGVTPSYLVRVARIAFLSPKVIEGILAGRLRGAVHAEALLKPEAIPLDWREQERRLLTG